MEDNILSADNLTVGYNEPVISNISVSIRSGSIVSLIGPNGSGKSTILKTLSGHIKRLGGDVLYSGKSIDKMPQGERAKMLSILLTERPLTDLMSCRELVEMGRYPHTGYFGRLSDSDKIAVRNAIEAVGIGDFSERAFSAVSDGQKQRVMLAAAICREPGILLLDEPTTFLDIHHKITFLETVKELAKKKGLAVAVTMHELELAKKISDYVVCIKDGAVFRCGEPNEIFCEEVICELFDISKELYRDYIAV